MTQTNTQSPFTPGAKVTWTQPLGPRRNMRRNCFAGRYREVPAKVVSVGPKLVTIEFEGQTHGVKARNLRPEVV